MRRLKFFLWLLFFPVIVSAAEPDWQLFKSTHFFVYYKNAPQSTVSELAQAAENCYNSITSELGFNRFNFWTWDNRAKIYLFDDQQEYRKDTGAADWSAGQAIASYKLIKTFVTAPGFLNNVLPHELAHIIFREMVGFNNPGVPLWLEEGVATYQEKDISLVKAKLAEKIKKGDFISLFDLNRSGALELDDQARVGLFYAEAFSLVKYLISEFGRDRFVFFCQSLRDSRNLAGALSKAYSFSKMADFEKGWMDYILR